MKAMKTKRTSGTREIEALSEYLSYKQNIFLLNKDHFLYVPDIRKTELRK